MTAAVMPSQPENEFYRPGYFPVSRRIDAHFEILKKRVRLALLSSDVNTSMLLVFRSRMLLGLLSAQFPGIEVIAACEGEAEACAVMERRQPGLLLLGDDLANGSAASVIRRGTTLHPDLRILLVLQRPQDLEGLPFCHGLLADADLGLRPDYPIFQAVMAMLTNTHYCSPALLEQAAQQPRFDPPGLHAPVKLTPREQDILSGYARGLSNQEVAAELQLSTHTVKTYSADLLAKLGVNNRQKALRKAVALGLARFSV